MCVDRVCSLLIAVIKGIHLILRVPYCAPLKVIKPQSFSGFQLDATCLLKKKFNTLTVSLFWADRAEAGEETGEQCQAASAGRANKPSAYC